MMNDPEESDPAVVAMNLANKVGPPIAEQGEPGLASKKWRALYEAGGSPCRRAVLRESFRMRPSASF
jgi:hypothetical protein